MPMQPYKSNMAHTFLLIFLFSSIISTNIHACNQDERNSLLSFALTLSSPPLNWTSIICCDWKGITCNKDGWVTHLLLPSKGLKGIFPSSLGNLTHLTHLNLSHNLLYGSLETQFVLSSNHLEVLDLSYNLLFGELPYFLPSKNIRIVDLSSNRFHGEIQSSFFQQAWNLISFNVSNNTFSGHILSSICLNSSPFVRLLDFSSNNFSGNLPLGIGECSKLQIFRAGYNKLSGLIPENIYNATKLVEISVPSNSLYGGISDTIVNLTNLAILDFFSNHLSGVMPLYFGKLSQLKFVTFDWNNLKGPLPPSLMNCTNLIELHLYSNNLGGDISTLNFSKLGQLSKLDLGFNNFTGTMPISLYSCRSLKAIRLSVNNLEGQIQPEILSLKSLSFLSLGYIKLTNLTRSMKILIGCKSLRTLLLIGSFKGEEIPADEDMFGLDGFQNLRVLGLADSRLTGQIPVWLSKLKNLEILLLGKNEITGSIPDWLGTLPRLFVVDLSFNQISGEFPKELCSLPRLVYESVAAQANNYQFELPIYASRFVLKPRFLQFYQLSQIPNFIDLGHNNINGKIPNEIGQLQFLFLLDLSFNNFSSNIPNEISNPKNLEKLYLNNNHFSGKIPSSLANVSFLNDFNVSNNNLEGRIPTSTQLQSFNASAFEGNLKLCGAPLPNECQQNKEDDADDNSNKHEDNGQHIPWFDIFVALGFIVGFWGVCGSLIINRTWRYAYFKFTDNVQDRLYVMLMVHKNRMKRKFRT